jgi:ketosteroid isomerase-like protein
MTEHPNATRIRALFQAFRDGDAASVDAALHDEVVWNFPGRRGALAGRHEGKGAVITFLLSVGALTEGTFHLELEDVVANDENAVALFRGSGKRQGRELDNPTCLRMRLREGRVVELWEFVWDLDHVEEFWA